MLSKLPSRRKNSFQPLIAMSAVLILPVFVSDRVSTSALITTIMPDLGNVNFSHIQVLFSCIFVAVGLGVWMWGTKKQLLNLILFYTLLATFVLILGLLSLLINLSDFGSNQAITLMKDAVVIWTMTALTFSLWYWLLDSGWTESQGVKDTPRQDFLFPQQINKIPKWDGWKPTYIEYLHLAFNTNTAFSPTDVSPLSHRVKILMVVQSSLALVIISTVAAQAINILSN